ncbi:MAG: hypothetical protein JRH19_16550, partial [Deltaproteobacteria bacterium]|nr:hypothetical protein [Deltaproteobacteria bacterium]
SHSGTTLYGELFQPLSRRIVGGATGWEIFLGYPLILASLASLSQLERPHLRSLWIVALFALALSFGPTLRVFSTDTGIAMPYAWLVDAPFFGQNRAPVRLAVFVLFGFAFFAAMGLDGLAKKAQGRVHPAAITALLLALLAWTLLETRPPPADPRDPFEIPQAFAELVEGPVMHVPFARQPGNQAFYQTLHGQPITYGYLARSSQRQIDHVEEFEAAIDAGGEPLRAILEAKGIENVIVTTRIPFLQLRGFLDLPVNVVLLHPQARELVALLGDLEAGMQGEGSERSGEAGAGGERWFRLPRATTAEQIDLRAGSNDHYWIELHRGPKRVGVLWAKPDHSRSGLSWRALELPTRLRGVNFDRIRVEGQHGDGRYEIAGLVISR